MPLPAPDLPPLSQPYYGVSQYSTTPINPASQYSQPSVEINPGAGAPGPNSGWTGRLPRYLMGGYAGMGLGAVNEAIRAIRGNRGFPSNNMRGANDRPAGGGGGSSFGNLFSGAPVNQANWTNYNAPYQHGAQNTAFSRSGNNNYSDRQSNLAQSAEDLALMASQANGGAVNNTGTTQDTGHTIFGAQSHTHGMMDDGIVTIQPGGIYDTVFRHGMGANNPNAYHSAQAPAQTALIEQQIRSQQAPSIGGNPSAPVMGPLQPSPAPQDNMSRAAEFYRNLAMRRVQGGR